VKEAIEEARKLVYAGYMEAAMAAPGPPAIRKDPTWVAIEVAEIAVECLAAVTGPRWVAEPGGLPGLGKDGHEEAMERFKKAIRERVK
jgi:hypothetical protein